MVSAEDPMVLFEDPMMVVVEGHLVVFVVEALVQFVLFQLW